MTQILYFLLWFFIFLYFFKIILRLVSSFLLKFFANRMKKIVQQFQNFNSTDNNYKQQEDFISKEESSKKSKTDNLGEYVDFEEIED